MMTAITIAAEKGVEEMSLWIYEYGCGCSDGPKEKSEMLEYCGIHGNDLRKKLRVPKEKAAK